ncbi:hypothetical protein COT40_02035, partial [Candidatus Peregrinibacteria bacterium CG08_land_8_20_14_0_20_41_10]
MRALDQQNIKTKEQEEDKMTTAVLETPEIVVQDEQGAQLLSLALKAKNPEWGSSDNPLAMETNKYFTENPLNLEISKFLDEIRALQTGGVDEEVLYILALTYKHPEREIKAFETIAKHKSYVKNPRELQQKLFRAIEIIKQSLVFSPLIKNFSSAIEEDKKTRLENL